MVFSNGTLVDSAIAEFNTIFFSCVASRARCTSLVFSVIFLIGSTASLADSPKRFDFGNGAVSDGWIPVASQVQYDPDRGYGFEFGTKVKFVDRTTQDPLFGDLALGLEPFYFSVGLPEGNYRIKIGLGDTDAAANCTVKVESRQLMLDNVETRPGQFVIHSFGTNIRTPQLTDGGSVRLKGREFGRLHWDEKLTIEFNGPRIALCSIEVIPDNELTTVFLLGDSTVTDQPAEPWCSWGQMLTRFFNDRVAISNHAASGESIKSSLSAGRVNKVFSMIRPGDFVFAQFGHNDMKDRSPNALKEYKSKFEELVDAIRMRGGIPVLVTSMERKSGAKKPTLKGYPEAIRQVAREKGVALIDLNRMSIDLYRSMGNQLGKLFQDGSHHNSFGSFELAKCMATGILKNVPELARHLRTEFEPFDPLQPDDFSNWRIPDSPNVDLTKPEGS